MSNGVPERRRWFQFRLRTLLIAVLVLSLPLSWFAVRMEKARKQREAVRAIQAVGGTVKYGFESMPSEQLPYPNWIRNVFGIDFVRKVEGVGFVDLPLESEVLANLDGFTELRVFTLDGTQIDDEGLRHLAGLPKLEMLTLQHTRVSDRGLVYLRGLPRLRYLLLENTQVTDAGLHYLKELSNLETLSLGPNVTRAGARDLKLALLECNIALYDENGQETRY